jgi:PAS domain S-box-containing protein
MAEKVASDNGRIPAALDPARGAPRGAADLRVHQDRYRVFIEDVADGFYEVDIEGNFTFFNEAMCRIFGRTREEIRGRNYRAFMDEENGRGVFERFNQIFRTGEGITDLIWEIIRRDGERRTVELSAHLILDENGEKTGFRGIARDVTQEKRAARINDSLFRISMALPRFRRLDERLGYIIREVQELLGVEGASVILLDEEKGEFHFPVASYDDTEAGRKMREIRFPSDKGVAGQVLRTGQPIIVPDYAKSPYAYKQVDAQSGHETRNMLDVPIRTEERIIGVLCAVNKKEGAFDQTDVSLLSTVASTVAFPIENARMDEALKRSYEEVQSLNRAKDRVIHHLSHELKIPVSVLAASLDLLSRKLSDSGDPGVARILARAGRNLNRILQMQYAIEDIMRERDFRVQAMFSTLLDTCADELEALAAGECGEGRVVERLRRRIEEIFGRMEPIRQEVRLDRFVAESLRSILPKFSHRRVELTQHLEPTGPIFMPTDPLAKVVEGLVRNAVENTPDGGRVAVAVRPRGGSVVLEVSDSGIGITPEDQRLIFAGVFTARETLQYASRRPYDFQAGGKGLDLLRMRIFSERYGFTIRLESRRCGLISQGEDMCPGHISQCAPCGGQEGCLESGGTTVTVDFPLAPQPGAGFDSR